MKQLIWEVNKIKYILFLKFLLQWSPSCELIPEEPSAVCFAFIMGSMIPYEWRKKFLSNHCGFVWSIIRLTELSKWPAYVFAVLFELLNLIYTPEQVNTDDGQLQEENRQKVLL